MSPRRTATPTARAQTELRRASVVMGSRVRDARLARNWSVLDLAERAGVSRDMVYRVEAGTPASIQTAARLATALERRLEIDLLDPRRRPVRQPLATDIVHSAMGELEARHLRALGFGVGIDEPYQHYQFAGRADVAAWDLERRALLHVENRTRFPDFQDIAGAFNAKRAYLASALGERLGVRRWASETHVLAGLWSAEVLHAIRLRAASFEALCPDDASAWQGWWSGAPPIDGRASTLIVLDPVAAGRSRRFVDLEGALEAKPRHRGYAAVAALLEPAT